MNQSIFELSEKQLRGMFGSHVTNAQQKENANRYKQNILVDLKDNSGEKVRRLLNLKKHFDDFEQARVFYAFGDKKGVEINCKLVSENNPNYEKAQKYLQEFGGEFLFLTCGGTIDKKYEDGKGAENYIIGNPVVGEIITEIGFSLRFKVFKIMKKDSLHMGDEMSDDRVKVAHEVDDNSQEKRIVITHGTDTAPETGRCIEAIVGNREIQARQQVITLVGSSRPYSDRETDAISNIDFAVTQTDIYQKEGKYGVYVAMDGEMIPVADAYKMYDGTFVNKKEVYVGDDPDPIKGYYYKGNGVFIEEGMNIQ